MNITNCIHDNLITNVIILINPQIQQKKHLKKKQSQLPTKKHLNLRGPVTSYPTSTDGAKYM